MTNTAANILLELYFDLIVKQYIAFQNRALSDIVALSTRVPFMLYIFLE